VRGTCEAGGRIKPGAQAPGSVFEITIEPAKRATAAEAFYAVAHFMGWYVINTTRSWGLRPRLYAYACFAG